MRWLHSFSNMPEDAIAEFQVYLGIYIYKDSEYERALNMQELQNVLIMPQYS